MSQIDAALVQASLMVPTQVYSNIPNPKKLRTRLQMAKRVFQLAASGGFAYTGQTHKQWAKKWLPSETFRLMEIDINAVASPHLPKNPERVAFRLLCSVDSVDPIVVDMNKQQVGKSHLGFVPKIIVVDGKHRKQGQLLQGRTRILAWVGCRAEGKIKSAQVIDEISFHKVYPMNPGAKPAIEAAALHYVRGQKEYNFKASPLSTAINLHCAVAPALGQTIVDQSGGERGSRPRDAMVKGNAHKPGCKCPACLKNKLKGQGAAGMGTAPSMGGPATSSLGTGSGSNPTMKPMGMKGKGKLIDECNACTPAFSQGSLDDPSASDDSGDIPDASDQSSLVSPSDRRHYTTKPNIKAPGSKGWAGQYGVDSYGDQAPGSGVGRRSKRSTGATRSEMSHLADTVPVVKSASMKAKSRVIDKIYVKDKSKKKLFTNLIRGK